MIVNLSHMNYLGQLCDEFGFFGLKQTIEHVSEVESGAIPLLLFETSLSERLSPGQKVLREEMDEEDTILK